jgi:ATP-dependent RNA helicase DDX10/DBP4
MSVLVLDEADRILDMGFSRTLTALLNHLPKSRQTLLFSATQTRSVADLARLSLNDPVQVDAAPEPTMGSSNPLVKGEQDPTLHMPKGLSQHYSVVPLPQKLSTLYSFLRTHLQSKTLVFLSSTKQVRHVYETFRRLQPGISLLHLHGKQKQAARLGTYERFAKVKEAVLFATDIAARGLDFARVDWVIQVDVPEDVQTYVHRVGRTARYESAGKALIFLCPSEEEGMVKRWKEKSVEVQKIKVSGKKVQDISNQLQNLAWKEPEIKYLAQRVRSFIVSLREMGLLLIDPIVFRLISEEHSSAQGQGDL